jgi:hypothetical protein
MVRGLERRATFRADADGTDLVLRLAGLAEHGAFTVYAWALLPNHAPSWSAPGPALRVRPQNVYRAAAQGRAPAAAWARLLATC